MYALLDAGHEQDGREESSHDGTPALERQQALMVTDTAFYRNPWYHTAFDTPERLDYERMARVTEGLAKALDSLASVERG